MILYRAANDATADDYGTTSFARRLSDARYYLDNPGFGGSAIYRTSVEVDPQTVLDIIDSAIPDWFRAACEAHGAAAQSWCITASEQMRQAMQEHGIRWVRFIDDYPEGCETWALIGHGDGYCDEIEMEEI